MPGDSLSCFVKIILGGIQLCQLATDKQVLEFIDNRGSFTGTHTQAQEMEAEGSLDQLFWWKKYDEALYFMRRLHEQKDKSL